PRQCLTKSPTTVGNESHARTVEANGATHRSSEFTSPWILGGQQARVVLHEAVVIGFVVGPQLTNCQQRWCDDLGVQLHAHRFADAHDLTVLRHELRRATAIVESQYGNAGRQLAGVSLLGRAQALGAPAGVARTVVNDVFRNANAVR